MIVSKFLSCVHTAILAGNCGTAWKCLVNAPRGSVTTKCRGEAPRRSASMIPENCGMPGSSHGVQDQVVHFQMLSQEILHAVDAV